MRCGIYLIDVCERSVATNMYFTRGRLYYIKCFPLLATSIQECTPISEQCEDAILL